MYVICDTEYKLGIVIKHIVIKRLGIKQKDITNVTPSCRTGEKYPITPLANSMHVSCVSPLMY